MTITGEHLRHLLGAGPNAALIVVEGRVEVIDDYDEDDQAVAGALLVISRSELVGRVSERDPSERELDEQAGVLDAAVANLGG